MALEMLTHSNTWCIKDIKKTKSGPEKNEAPHFLNTRGPNGPEKYWLIF